MPLRGAFEFRRYGLSPSSRHMPIRRNPASQLGHRPRKVLTVSRCPDGLPSDQIGPARFGHSDRSRLSGRWSWTASASLMDSTSKSVRLPVQNVQQRTGVATYLWFCAVCSGNALYPCAWALFWTEQVQKQCCAPVELGHRLINKRGTDVVENSP